MPFSQLGLSEKVIAAVTAAGYPTPTPIQEQAIPHVLARRDVLGIAQTGTGKTAAFTLPMLTMLETGRARARMPRTLILEPTRELAAQVQESFEKYGAKHKLNVALLIGGVSFDDQDNKIMRGVDVLIATPGRLLDHFERGRLLMSGVELLVIDEADRMLDMGFIPDIERICKLVPFTRQTLFFTATMPPEIRRITEQFLHNPVKVEVSRPATAATTITQKLVKTGRETHEKRDVLRRLIKSADPFKNAIIFCNRKTEVAILHRSLVKHGFNAVCLHGDMEQSARTAALDKFRKGEADAADRLRRRRARSRHPGCQPRFQFRRAASPRRLRASHRPHRPRRQVRRRDHDCLAGRPEIGRRDRKADWTTDRIVERCRVRPDSAATGSAPQRTRIRQVSRRPVPPRSGSRQRSEARAAARLRSCREPRCEARAGRPHRRRAAPAKSDRTVPLNARPSAQPNQQTPAISRHFCCGRFG